ncbi:hypothetical protein ACFXPN_33680 [Streptomyces griseorubiginosus]|uniref:hypothetical protein n=1 Tax=Streptomyces griseorubiginosus TaxID=67304 RepID=UPI00369B745E
MAAAATLVMADISILDRDWDVLMPIGVGVHVHVYADTRSNTSTARRPSPRAWPV